MKTKDKVKKVIHYFNNGEKVVSMSPFIVDEGALNILKSDFDEEVCRLLYHQTKDQVQKILCMHIANDRGYSLEAELEVA